MQTHQLERMLRLANKTGGKLIITDSAGNRPVVILGLDEYEALLDGQKLSDVGRRASGSEARSTIPTTESRQPNPVAVLDDEDEDDGDDEADVTMMEEALLAVEESMPEAIAEEPKVVPVKALETEAERPQVLKRVVKDTPEVAPVAESADEVGEEQFYLEPL